MCRPFNWKIAVLMVLLAQPSMVLGQSVRRGRPPGQNTTAWNQTASPREQRAARNRAIAAVGHRGRDFVETYGDDAVVAIFACTWSAAQRLVTFHTSGGLANLPRPRDLLRVIGMPGHGDDVAIWAIAHAVELMDADYFDAYLLDPLSYALALKNLEDGAAEIRERRGSTSESWAFTPDGFASMPNSRQRLLFAGGCLALFILLIWRIRKYRNQNQTGL